MGIFGWGHYLAYHSTPTIYMPLKECLDLKFLLHPPSAWQSRLIFLDWLVVECPPHKGIGQECTKEINYNSSF